MKNKIKVLILNPNYDKIIDSVELPLGIAYVIGYLKKFDWIEVVSPQSPLINKTLEEILSDTNYDAICTGGMFVNHHFYKDVFNLANIHQKKAVKILGGPIVESLDYKEVFEYLKIDIAIRGEGEATLVNVLDALMKKIPLKDVNGIIFKDNKELVITNPQPLIDMKKENLLPDWTWMFPTIKESGRKDFNSFYKLDRMPILASRGCPNKCDFCHSPFESVRKRNVTEVIDEIKTLKENYNVSHFAFMDETFTANSRRMQELCAEIINHKLNITWSCGVRTNLVSLDVLKLMKESGCIGIQLGVESGSDKILKMMNKNSTVKHNRNAINLIREAKILPRISVMLGYEKETIEDIKLTVDFLIEMNEFPEFMSHTTPVPGTPLYDRALEQKSIKVNSTFEYIDSMNQGIYLTNKPFINLTPIPDNIYWKSLLMEKQRLYTTLAFNNRIKILDYTLNNNILEIKAECPHCKNELNFNQSFRWISQRFCNNCNHHVWFHLQDIDIFKNAYSIIENFINEVNKNNDKLVLIAETQNAISNFYSIFYYSPWSEMWKNVYKIRSNKNLLYFEDINKLDLLKKSYKILDLDIFKFEEMKV